jgi:spermidine synthase
MTIDFTSLAQSCTDADDFQARVLDSLQHAVGFDAAFFLPKGGDARPTTMGLRHDVAALLADRGDTYARELAPVTEAALSARGVAVDSSICGLQHVQRTRYFRDIAATVNGKHALMAYVPWRGRTAAALMLGRSGPTFSGRDIAFVESLLPHLGVARAALGLPSWSAPPLPGPPRFGLPGRLRYSLRPNVLASARTARGTVVVRDRNGFREMVATGGARELIWSRASVKDPSKSGWPYVDLFHLAPALAKHRTRALFVGSGGGVCLHQFASAYPGIQLDVVEHEPAVLQLAKDWFALDTVPNLTVHITDGARSIEAAPPVSWDIVAIDAFDTHLQADARMQQAAFGALLRVLRPGGTVAWNIIGSLSPSGAVADFVASARSAFNAVRLVPVVDVHEKYAPDTARNIVIIATT